jgi:hypothetical protein
VLGSTTKLVLGADLAYGGNFNSSGTTSLGAHRLTLSGNSTVGGTIFGTGGTLDLAAGTFSFAAANNASTWTLESGVVVNETVSRVSYSGAFSAAAATLALNGKVLVLNGASSFTGSTVDGGFLQTRGATTVAGLTVGGAASWQNYGTATQSGGVTIGDASGSTAIVSNFAGATYDLTADVGLTPEAGGSGSFNNSGLLEKTGGAGTSVIGLRVNNSGAVGADSGTLDIKGAISGTGGALDINGAATLQLDGTVAAKQQVNFSGSGGTLALTNPRSFAAKIAGFAAGDFLDLTAFDPTKTTVGFVENAGKTQGTLTVTQGATHVSFTLLGQYAAAGFQAEPDSGAGTNIVYNPPPSPAVALLVPSHG